MANGRTRTGGHLIIISKRAKERITNVGKLCTKCAEDLPLKEYYNNYSHCKACQKEISTELRRRNAPLW